MKRRMLALFLALFLGIALGLYGLVFWLLREKNEQVLPVLQ